MSADDVTYYRKRAQEERERALVCEDNSVVLAHRRLADEYERRVQQLQVRDGMKSVTNPSAGAQARPHLFRA
jgi:hypothetical protein